MKLLDVNVVLAAHRNDHPLFEIASPWLEGLVASGEPFGVPDGVWVSFVRLATNRRIFAVPTSLPDAFEFLRAVRAQTGHVAIAPGSRHLELFEHTCRGVDASGDLAADAHLAALAIEHGAELVSFDRDFARFPALRWTLPG